MKKFLTFLLLLGAIGGGVYYYNPELIDLELLKKLPLLNEEGADSDQAAAASSGESALSEADSAASPLPFLENQIKIQVDEERRPEKI